MDVDLYSLKITATEVAYYIICKRKLWLFSKGVNYESENEFVLLGKLLDETTYKRSKKEENPFEGLPFKLDFFTKDGKLVVHEVKHSDKLEEAHKLQVKFYLWALKKMGLEPLKGILHYPKQMKVEEVFLTPEDEREIETALKGVEEVKNLEKPPKVERKSYCKRCAYFEFCFT
jgi:CRISPR-associated exonuclease Cas4